MNISSWIDKWAQATPDKIALRFEGQEISYCDFNNQIKAIARDLKHSLDLRPGDRVAYLGQNCPQMLAMVFSCARLGAIFVPLNWRLAAKEHLHMLKDSGAGWLFVDGPYLDHCEQLKNELPDCRFIALQGEDRPGWRHMSGHAGADADDHYPDIGLDRPLLIIYTSGTTGAPKGAVLSQQAIQTNAFNSAVMHDMNSSDVVLTFLPMFHVGGLNIQTTAGLHAGATIILHRNFDPQRVLDSIIDDKSTLTIILPAHMPALQSLPDWESSDLSSLRSVTTGSTTIADEMVHYWHGKDIPLLQVYGASETCPIAIHQTMGNAFSTAGTIGFPAMHCEIRIVDDNGEDCGPGVPGEILVRGQNVMSCYWNNPGATANSLIDGWFYSGDIAYVDATGCFHFVDRKKDVIISGGENIYPAEIENALLDHPDILEVGVVGRQEPTLGETPIAVLALRENRTLSQEQVLDWLNGRLGKFKHPRGVLFVDALPRNAMRKVLKNELRDMVNQ